MRRLSIHFAFTFLSITVCAQNIDFKEAGDLKLSQNNYTGAILDYSKAIEANPKDLDAYHIRGRAKYMAKDYAGAIKDYTTILSINPKVRAVNWVYIHRGLAQSALEDHLAAAKDYTKAFDDLSDSDELQPEKDYPFHTQAWPDLEEMLIIQKSFEIAGSKSTPTPQNSNFIIGTWIPSMGGGRISFNTDGSYLIQGTTGKKTYDFMYNSNNLMIITLDSLKGTSLSTYDYCVAKNITNEAGIINQTKMAFRDYGNPNLSAMQLGQVYNKLTYKLFKRFTVVEMNEAMKLLGLKNRDHFEFGGQDIFGNDFFYDEEEGYIIYEKANATSTHLNVEKMDPSVFKTAAYLDQFHPYWYLPVSLILLKNAKFNEAAFLLHLGKLREAYFNYGNDWADVNDSRFGQPINQMVNQFISDDIESYAQLKQTVLNYYMANEHQYAKPRAEDMDQYKRQIANAREEIGRLYTYRAEQMSSDDNEDYEAAIAEITKSIERAANEDYRQSMLEQRQSLLERSAEQKQKIVRTIADYTKAIEVDPDNGDSYKARGDLKAKLLDSDGAIADYTKAIELDPSDASSYLARGDLKSNHQDSKGAIADYTKAIEIDSSNDNRAAYYSRGDLKAKLKDSDGAIADYTKVIEINPADASSYLARGDLKARFLDSNGAITDYTKAIEVAPDYLERKDVDPRLLAYGQLDDLKSKGYYARGLVKQNIGQKDSGCQDLQVAFDRTRILQTEFRFKVDDAVLQYCTKEKVVVDIDINKLEPLVGKYYIPTENAEVSVSIEKNKIYIQMDESMQEELLAESETHFFVKSKEQPWPTTIEFIKENGKVTGMVWSSIQYPQGKVEFKKYANGNKKD